MDALLQRIRDIEAARKMAAVLMARYSSRFVRNGAGNISKARLELARRVSAYWATRWL